MATMGEVARGLAVFLKYGDGFTVAAEHDVFYAGPPSDSTLSAADVRELEDAHWNYDDETESWSIFT